MKIKMIGMALLAFTVVAQASEPLDGPPVKEYPYKMVMQCTGAPMLPVAACFAPGPGGIGTSFDLENGHEDLYINPILWLRPPYQFMHTMTKYLKEHFAIKAQASTTGFILKISVIDRSSGEVVYEKSASDYEAIMVRN